LVGILQQSYGSCITNHYIKSLINCAAQNLEYIYLDTQNLDYIYIYILVCVVALGGVMAPAAPPLALPLLVMPQSMSLSLDTWRHRTRPCGGVRCCCWLRVVARGWGESWSGPTYSSFTTRLKIVAWVLRFYTTVRGTLVSGYQQWPLGPPQGRMRACRWGQSLYFASTWPNR
jgi:hypothetical protein